jgi:hypothetical protein
LPQTKGIEWISAEHSMQETLMRPLATVCGVRVDRNASLQTTREWGWPKVGSMIRRDDTLICIMARTQGDTDQGATAATAESRRAFIRLVEGLPVSMIVSPDEPFPLWETHDVH